MSGKGFFLFCVICLYCLVQSFAQNPYSEIRIESGGTLQFSVNSLKKYEEGIVRENWTRMAITFEDTDDSAATWKLVVKALESEIIGDYSNTLPLDQIIIEVFDAGGANNLGAFIQPAQNLTASDVTLIQGAPQGDFTDNVIYISYRLGTENRLLGEAPDYYFVDIEFELSKF